MKQIKTNIFSNIHFDDLEHIRFNIPAFGIAPFPGSLPDFKDLKNFKFTKKYNLLYQNENMESGCDLHHHKKESTDLIEEVLSKNKDKVFMIIDHGMFNHLVLQQYKNCQIWPRKYFAPSHGRTHHGSRDVSIIEKQRKHWFCSVNGRHHFFREQMFDWVMDQGLEKNNKVSYLGVGAEGQRSINDIDPQLSISKYKDKLPFNNFEYGDIPESNQGRIEKPMPLYDCLFNIVIETFITGQCANNSEKSLNTILYGHIPVIIGGEGSMKRLQDMGMIIPDYIQWSVWDEIPIDQLNFSKLHIMQRQMLDLFSKNKLNDIAEDWYPYAVRNLKKFVNLHKECAVEEQEICRWILTTTHNLKNAKYQYLYDKKYQN